MVTPAGRRQLVEHFRVDFGMSERRACGLAGQPRSTHRYRRVRPNDAALRTRLRELASERPRFGYRRLGILLRREGDVVNHKRVYRIYRSEGLIVRKKRRRRISQANRMIEPAATKPNDCWSMDFISDRLNDGRALRVFAVVDDHSKLSPTIEVDLSLPAVRILRALDRAIELRGKPCAVRTDNGPEFASHAFDAWAYRHGIEHRFIRPGKPVENAYAESFNSRVRDECLNLHCFESPSHARELLDDWLTDYNELRPHTALGGRSPNEYLQSLPGGGPQAETADGQSQQPQPAQAAV